MTTDAPAIGIVGMKKGAEIQAVWFDAKIWSLDDARTWAVEHEFVADTHRVKRDAAGAISHHILPQFEPDDPSIVEDSWGVIADDFPEGITASICVRNKHLGLINQSLNRIEGVL